MATALPNYSPANRFLDLISKWEYDVPLTTQWFVTITPKNPTYFLSKLNDKNNSGLFKDNGVILGGNQLNLLLNSSVQKNIEDPDASGLFFVQNIKLPKEAFTISTAAVESMGGYLKGAVAGDRLTLSERSINIGFLETNLDFNDGVIRPWIITAGYEGLVSVKGSSIKADIRVAQYTKARGSDKKPRRKLFEFFDCVPYSMGESSLDYEGEKINVSSVDWVFNNYSYTIV